MMTFLKNSFLNDFIKNGKYTIFNNNKFGLALHENGMCNLIYRGDKSENIEQLGFRKYADDIYTLEVKQSEIKSAFYTQTYCIYQYGKYGIENIVNGKVILWPNCDTLTRILGRHPYDDGIYRLELSYIKFMEEVEEIWEERTPIDGFIFDVEPVYYIKKMKKTKK